MQSTSIFHSQTWAAVFFLSWSSPVYRRKCVIIHLPAAGRAKPLNAAPLCRPQGLPVPHPGPQDGVEFQVRVTEVTGLTFELMIMFHSIQVKSLKNEAGHLTKLIV